MKPFTNGRKERRQRKNQRRAERQLSLHQAAIAKAHTCEVGHMYPARANIWKGQVIIKSGEKGRGQDVVRQPAPTNTKGVALICLSVMQQGFYIINPEWKEGI